MTEYIVDTLAEALAIAKAISDPGAELEVHAADCEVDEDGQGCTCEPVIVIVGERAEA